MLITSERTVETAKKVVVAQFIEDKKAFRKNAIHGAVFIGFVISIIVMAILRPIKVLFF